MGGGLLNKECHHHCMDVVEGMRGSCACGSACLNMHTLTTHSSMGHSWTSTHFGPNLMPVISINIMNILDDFMQQYYSYCEN